MDDPVLVEPGESGELTGPTSGEERECIYSSDRSPVELIKSELPKEVTDDIFHYKRICLYYTKSDEWGPSDLIIEISEPYFSPYVNKISVDNITLDRIYSSGAEELSYSGPVGPGVEGRWHETHLLTYSIDFDETYFGATSSRLVMDMKYDLEGYGTGKIKADIWIEP